ncbi:hypothetical protein DL770_009779 [Monosporascus sp. CRB-9-2]|nr:hypothetical protein DL770_009779 [Monosporascus sp. CRB-9-2]
MDGDDSRQPLRDIATHHQQPIVSLLVGIQRHQARQSDFLGFLSHLECFKIDDNENILYRRWINAWEKSWYVALSYTWKPSKYEDGTSGGYGVQNRSQEDYFESPVRNCVFERVMKYMRHEKVDLLWIDRHSIPQQRSCDRKNAGLQSMDWVYKQSAHPLALLGRPIGSPYELQLLYEILEGEFVVGHYRAGRSHHQLSENASRRRARDALLLLHKITSDLWWRRAWTFQENYKGGRAMTLLISHQPSWDRRKRRYRIFGQIPGELCINSVEFSDQATRLCQAFRHAESQTPEEKRAIRAITTRAGRYTVLLKESESMAPAIIADVGSRGVSDPWDRLAIVANCCSYPKRLHIQQLREKGHSLSLSMLAMCLLNGQILHNRRPSQRQVSGMTVSRFLKAQSFDGLSSPQDERSRAFNKGCRFINAKLTEAGVLTSGHLWKLGRTTPTAQFDSYLPLVWNVRGRLTTQEQQLLTQLYEELNYYPESRILASQIEDYLNQDAMGNEPFEFGENYVLMMAAEVASAIREGKVLRLGSLEGEDQYSAVFVWGDESSERFDHEPAFVFTSSQPKKPASGGHDANDTDRHVSLEVEFWPRTRQTGNGFPHFVPLKLVGNHLTIKKEWASYTREQLMQHHRDNCNNGAELSPEHGLGPADVSYLSQQIIVGRLEWVLRKGAAYWPGPRGP